MMKRNFQPSLPALTWVALLVLLQATTLQAHNESSPPLFPPGKVVNMGGWRLHLNCTGDEPELVIQSIREVADAAAKALVQDNVTAERKSNVLKDKDGNTYTSKIMLDGKRWMTQNLNLKVTGSYCFDDKRANCDRYGRLYTWEAAKKGCDLLGDGWRLPTDDEWRAMAKHYGGVRDDSGETGKAAYQALLVGGSSEFNALLGGNRDADGKYARFDAHGFYWSATEHSSGEAWFFNFGRGAQILNRHNNGDKPWAWSVRCIRP